MQMMKTAFKSTWILVGLIFVLNIPLVQLWLPVKGKLLPDDPYVYIGDTLTLTCTLFPSYGINSADLFFRNHSGAILNESETTVITVIDDLTAKLEVNIKSAEDQGSYKCVTETDHIAIQHVTVEFPPQKIVNFTCTVFNWEWWVCTWSHPVEYINRSNGNKDIEVSLWYATQSHEYAKCPEISFEKCVWTNSPTIEQNHYIKVIVKNTKTEDTATYEESINNLALVKPAPVTQFSGKPVSSECVDLQWQHNARYRYLLFREVVLLGDEQVFLNNMRTFNNETWIKKRICDLTPFTEYEFRVSSIPLVIFANFTRHPIGYWSDTVSQSVLTNESVPTGAPVMLKGLYTSKPSSANSGNRTVIISWKAPEKHLQNGIITGYKIQVCPVSLMKKCRPEERFKRGGEYTVSFSLYQNVTYNVSVVARTSIGFSAEVSSVIVYSQHEELPKPKHVVAAKHGMNGSDFTVMEWGGTEKNGRNSTEYIVVWCLHDESRDMCKVNNEINWKAVGNATSTQIRIEEPLSPLDYMYGVYARENEQSSGIAWSSCVYIKSEVPKDPPTVMLPDETVRDNSIKVTWRNPDCMKSKALVREYVIKYCLSQNKKCLEDMQNKSISADENEFIYNLQNLKSESYYRISMLSVAEAGLSPESEPVYAVPAPPGTSRTEEIFTIIGATLGSCVGLGIILVCICRKIGCIARVKNLHGKVTRKVVIQPPDTMNVLKDGDSTGYMSVDYYTNRTPNEDDDVFDKVPSTDEFQGGKFTHQDSGTGTMTPPVEENPEKLAVPILKVILETVNKIKTDNETDKSPETKQGSQGTSSIGTGSYMQVSDMSPKSESDEPVAFSDPQTSNPAMKDTPLDTNHSHFRPQISNIQVATVIQQFQPLGMVDNLKKIEKESLDVVAGIDKEPKARQTSEFISEVDKTEMDGFIKATRQITSSGDNTGSSVESKNIQLVQMEETIKQPVGNVEHLDLSITECERDNDNPRKNNSAVSDQGDRTDSYMQKEKAYPENMFTNYGTIPANVIDQTQPNQSNSYYKPLQNSSQSNVSNLDLENMSTSQLLESLNDMAENATEDDETIEPVQVFDSASDSTKSLNPNTFNLDYEQLMKQTVPEVGLPACNNVSTGDKPDSRSEELIQNCLSIDPLKNETQNDQAESTFISQSIVECNDDYFNTSDIDLPGRKTNVSSVEGILNEVEQTTFQSDVQDAAGYLAFDSDSPDHSFISQASENCVSAAEETDNPYTSLNQLQNIINS